MAGGEGAGLLAPGPALREHPLQPGVVRLSASCLHTTYINIEWGHVVFMSLLPFSRAGRPAACSSSTLSTAATTTAGSTSGTTSASTRGEDASEWLMDGHTRPNSVERQWRHSELINPPPILPVASTPTTKSPTRARPSSSTSSTATSRRCGPGAPRRAGSRTWVSD